MRSLQRALLVLATYIMAAHLSAAETTLEDNLQKLGEAGREKTLAISEKNKDAIVLVEFVISIKLKIDGNEQPAKEQRIKAPGTMTNADGLTLASNSATDPTDNIRQQLAARLRGRAFEVQSSIKEVKIVLNDGTEIEAEVAIKDKELDIVFVRPKEKLEEKISYITLDPKVDIKQLSRVIIIGRMNMDAGRAVLVNTGSIQGIITKPRKYFVSSPSMPGLPALDKDGKCFGMFLPRRNASGISMGQNFILPADEILTVAAQIKKAEGEAKEEPKKTE